MDRSFLSRSEVIAASRQFVCIRLATYEDKTEGNYLRSFGVGHGDLDNTVFCILSPDGKERLLRATRGTWQSFSDSRNMAETMNRIAGRYSGREAPDGSPALPLVANLRLAINMAAADDLPLAVVVAANDSSRQELERRVSRLAWSDAFIGRFLFVAASPEDVAGMDGARPQEGVLFIQPDDYGLKGKALKQVGRDVSSEQLAEAFRGFLASHEPSRKSFQSHVRNGHRQGVFWETLIPVTDPMEIRARERGRLGRKPG